MGEPCKLDADDMARALAHAEDLKRGPDKNRVQCQIVARALLQLHGLASARAAAPEDTRSQGWRTIGGLVDDMFAYLDVLDSPATIEADGYPGFVPGTKVCVVERTLFYDALTLFKKVETALRSLPEPPAKGGSHD